jgi:hypothetical protein
MENPARQLIVCCDGTNNTLTAGIHDTNVVKLMNLLAPGEQNQKLYYDPGVGAADQLPGTDILNDLSRKFSRLRGLASGRGIYENIASAYRFLAEQYQEGDEVFLFGFSRGAFTARAVAGMVNAYGLLQPHNMEMLDTLVHAYFAAPAVDSTKRKRGDVLDYIHKHFPERSRDVEIHFIGVFDTVESVGLPGFRRKFTSDGVVSLKRYRHVRQALSLDETRWTFTPRVYWEGDYDTGSRSLKQGWFRGAHADIGGGYPEETDVLGLEAATPNPQAPRETWLSDQTLRWMLVEACDRGLRLRHGAVLPSDKPRGRPVLHNEAVASPFWAVAGLTVRHRALPAHTREQIGELPAVRKPRYAYDDQAATLVNPAEPIERWWPPGGQWLQHFAALCLLIVFYGCANAYAYAALHGGQFPPLDDMFSLFRAGREFDAWQRTGFPRFVHAAAGIDHGYAAWSILFDFGLIASYAWFLGWLTIRRFLHLTGMPGSPGAPDAPGWLVLALGWLPCALVASDVIEDLATLLALACNALQAPLLAYLPALVMSAANNAKWLAFVLILAAFAASHVIVLAKRRHPPGKPPSTIPAQPA